MEHPAPFFPKSSVLLTKLHEVIASWWANGGLGDAMTASQDTASGGMARYDDTSNVIAALGMNRWTVCRDLERRAPRTAEATRARMYCTARA